MECEADPRQAEKLIDAIGLSGDNVRSTVTPGLKCAKAQVDEQKDLEQHEHATYRGNVARCNYLGPDGPDITDQLRPKCT